MKIIQHRSIILLNIKCQKAKATVARNQLHQVTEWRKRENPGSVGPVLLWPTKECDSGSITKQIVK